MSQYDDFLCEYEEWRSFLNKPISLFMVASGLSVMSSQYHMEATLVILLFTMLFSWTSGKFPRLIASLRKVKRNDKQQVMYTGLLSTFFGLKASIVKFHTFSASCLFIGTVFVGLWH